MFRFFNVVVILALSAIVIAVDSEEFRYSDRYDHIDIDQILANPRQRETYFKCFLGTGPCVTADAKFFHDRFAEAFSTNCKKCTPKQLDNFNKLTDWYTKNEPEKYQAIVEAVVKQAKKA